VQNRWCGPRALEAARKPPTSCLAWTGYDILGNGSGVDQFTRFYATGTNVRLIAPATNGSAPFRYWVWTELGMRHFVYTPTLHLTFASVGLQATAHYATYVPGSFTAFGAGCRGSSNAVLGQVAAGTPDIGQTATYQGQLAPPFGSVWLMLGLSNTAFGALPLPFDNGPIGAPGCFTYCSHDVIYPLTASFQGLASVAVPFPNATNLVGSRVHTQYWALDLAANSLGLTTSRAITTQIGGPQ
jgi:hypothetical protein